MKLVRKTILSLLVIPLFVMTFVKGSEEELTTVFLPHSTISVMAPVEGAGEPLVVFMPDSTNLNPSYAERLNQSFNYCSEQAILGTQQIGRALYRNKGIVISSALALSTFCYLTSYYLTTVSFPGERGSPANSIGFNMTGVNILEPSIPAANILDVNITGTCPQSIRFEDLLNGTLRGCNGVPMTLNWWNAETNGSIPSIWGTELDGLNKLVYSLNETWSNSVTGTKDYVTTALDKVGNFFCSCLYGLKPDHKSGTQFVFSVMLPFVKNVYGLGLNADGSVREYFLGKGLSGGPDDGTCCPAIVNGDCRF